ncbi:MAG: N-acyl homoserine lactonase family protein, partial [Sphingomicrobium sp.]
MKSLARLGLIAGLLMAGAAPARVETRPMVSLYRLDCGSILIKDFNAFFSDTGEYRPGERRITDSCYLIRHMDHYMLWDTGFPAATKVRPMD